MKLRFKAAYHQTRAKRRYDTQRLQNPEVAQEFVEKFNASCQPDAVLSWSGLTSMLRSSAEETLGFQQHTRKQWISDATWNQIEARRKLKGQLHQARSREEKRLVQNAYNGAEKAVKRMAREDKRNYFKGLANEADAAARCGNMRGVYSATRKLCGSKPAPTPPLKDSNGNTLTSEHQQLDRWKEFFSEHHPIDEAYIPFPPVVRRNPRRLISTVPPSVPEIESAIRKLKNHKAPGPDNLPAELYKATVDTIAPILQPIIREAWTDRCIPDSWKEGVIVTIPKKGNLNECKNWRGITLLNAIQKILASLILHRISPAIEAHLRREQAGFRPNRSCVDHINTIRMIIEQSVEWNNPVYLLFVDFERAFDMVRREAIWNALTNIGIPESIIDLIRELYRETPCKVRFKGKDSSTFTTNRGVRQGCVLSPLLFITVLDLALNRTNNEAPSGIQWSLTEKLHDLDYADDICLFSNSFNGIQDKLRALDTNAKTTGLRINIAKTKLMRIGSRCETPLLLNGEPIEDVAKFCYLGSMVCKDGGAETDVSSRIDKARSAYHSLGNVWRSNQLSTSLKLRLFNSNVKSVLLYGCETWKTTNSIDHKLQVFVNKCLRRILKIFWPEWVTNADLLQRAGQQPIAAEIRRRKWSWIGHTLRKPETDVARMALTWTPQGTRSRGRPRSTWRRTVEKEHRQAGKSWPEVTRLARDRTSWRTFADSLIPLCAP